MILLELLLVLYENKSSRICSTGLPYHGQSDSPTLHPGGEGEEEKVDWKMIE